MPRKLRINDRYELGDVIGRGGMGVVYRAYDTVVKREVAVKTIRDLPSPKAFDLFRKECGVMASMSHPNIVEIFDIGEFEEGGSLKPFLVMPLLAGATLDELIRKSTQRLTVDRAIDIICQTCRGLQTAHERGLVHRDLKPSNIFVMPDHSVKVIDFGLAHMADNRTSMTVRGGTLLYMAPEQLEMKPPTPLSDIFSLGVVFYEMLTCRRPFEPSDASTEQEVINAILHHSPVPVTDLNPEVSQVVSRVVHKTLAKQPWNRFKSARELAETLIKAQRNEPIFDDAAIEPRVQRAVKAFEKENYQFAGEILNELEAEGHLHPTIPILRRQIDQAVRQRQITQLLDSARTCFQEEEYLLALQKLQEVLQMDKTNPTALALKATVENRLSEQKVEQWLRLARQHLEHNAFTLAREALQNLLQVRPKEATALQLLAEADRREQQYLQARKEKNELYEAAVEAWKHGEMSAALSRMERLIDLDRQVPDLSSSDRALAYQTFYNEIRSEYDASRSAYQEARKNLLDGKFSATLEICTQYLAKYPDHALFQALKFDVEERQRQELSSRIAEIDRSVELEADLDRRVNILKDALEQYPGEPHFERALRLMRDRRDLVASIVNKARSYEDRGQFNEALGQWETLQTIHQQYPGLQFEIERLVRRRDQQARVEAKTRWVDQIDRQLETGDYTRALELIRNATSEFPGDAELATLERLALQGQARDVESRRLLAEGQQLCACGKATEGLPVLQKAHELDPRNVAIRTAYVNALLQEANAKLNSDWSYTGTLVLEALALDPAHPLGRSLQTLVLDRKREEFVVLCVTEARELQARADDQGALARVEQGLKTYPQDQQLLQLKATLRRSVSEVKVKSAAAGFAAEPIAQPVPEARVPNPAAVYPQRANVPPTDDAEQARAADLEELRSFWNDYTQDSALIGERLKRAEAIAERHRDDQEIGNLVTDFRSRVTVTILPSPVPSTLTPEAPKTPEPDRSPAIRLTEQIRRLANRIHPEAAIVYVKRYGLWWAAGAGTVFLITLPLIWLFTRPAGLQIRVIPEGAAIRIDGQLRGTTEIKQKLAPGVYKIEVSKDGFESKTSLVTLTRGRTENQQIELKPIAVPPPIVQLLQIVSDQAGQLTLDNQPPVDLPEGQFTLNSLPWGAHTLRILSGKTQTDISIQTDQNTIATLSDSLKSSDVLVLLLAANSGRARIYSNSPNSPVALKGPAGESQSIMKDLGELESGEYSVAVQVAQEKRTMSFTVAATPSLLIWVTSGQKGTVRVLTGVEGASVLVDKRRPRQTNARGEAFISGLEPGSHRVKVEKEGYKPVDALTITIEKGKEAIAEFQLHPLPARAALVLRDLPPGAQVTLDKNPSAVITEGTLHVSDITPGDHEIGISLPKFKAASIYKTFRAGETVELARSDFSLQPLYGFVDITIRPSEAKASILVRKLPNGNDEPYITGQEIMEGQYSFSAQAEGYERAPSQPLTVTGGQRRSLILNLTATSKTAAVPPKAPPARQTSWLKDAGLKEENGWYIVSDGRVLLGMASPLRGTTTFTVYRKAGILSRNPAVGWVTNFVDSNNYVMVEIEGNKFRRTVIEKGKSTPAEHEMKVRSSAGKDASYQVSIQFSGSSIVHKVYVGSHWETVDSWSETGRDHSQGKFGFAAKDMRVASFRFDPVP
jgi:eukaryotic-like serine/threonine-protein kinase